MRQASKVSHINWEIELSTDQIRKNRRKPSIQGGPTQIATRRRKSMINQHRKTGEHPLPITTKSTNPRPHGTSDASKTHEFSEEKTKYQPVQKTEPKTKSEPPTLTTTPGETTDLKIKNQTSKQRREGQKSK